MHLKVNSTLFLLGIILFISLKVVWLNEIDEEEKIDKNKIDKQKGLDIVLAAVKTLINGDTGPNPYKDIFVDTSKPAFAQLESAYDHIPIDTVLRVIYQTVLVLTANKRIDLLAKPVGGLYQF
jgi:cadmium resistance protein CadD (predicted permease)